MSEITNIGSGLKKWLFGGPNEVAQVSVKKAGNGPDIYEKLHELGYVDQNGGVNRRPDVVFEFQLLCGIYDGQRGMQVGPRTNEAVDIALRAKRSGKNWKKEVAGMYDGSADPVKAKQSLAKLKGYKIQYDGINLNSEDRDRETIRNAYRALGFKADTVEELVFANYKFQIISGVNDKRNLAPVYGPATHKALVKALEAAASGKDWRKVFGS